MNERLLYIVCRMEIPRYNRSWFIIKVQQMREFLSNVQESYKYHTSDSLLALKNHNNKNIATTK